MESYAASRPPSAPYLDLADPAFDVTSPAVHAAREERWWVETAYGIAVLRHEEAGALLKDRRFRQGNARWPAQNQSDRRHCRRSDW